jgi:hypothetical protein
MRRKWGAFADLFERLDGADWAGGGGVGEVLVAEAEGGGVVDHLSDALADAAGAFLAVAAAAAVRVFVGDGLLGLGHCGEDVLDAEVVERQSADGWQGVELDRAEPCFAGVIATPVGGAG